MKNTKKGKTTFTKSERDEIISLIEQKQKADTNRQKGIRSKIRKLKFYFTDFYNIGEVKFDVDSFNRLIDEGRIRITEDDSATKASKIARPERTSRKPEHTVSDNQHGGSDENYVIDMCNEVLGETASRQHRFDFLTGDTGRRLPVDAYYTDKQLVIEYNEIQHTKPAPFFDNMMTVSGVNRGVQRKRYDQRRLEVLPEHGIRVIVISYTDFGKSKRLRRNRAEDLEVVRRILADYI